MHAVLDGEHPHALFAVEGEDAIKEGGAQALRLRLLAHNRGSELAMVAGQDQLLGFEDRDPTGDLEGHSGLIDDTHIKFACFVHIPQGRAGVGAEHHLRAAHDFPDGFLLALSHLFAQGRQLAAKAGALSFALACILRPGALAALLAELPQCLVDLTARIVGQRLAL